MLVFVIIIHQNQNLSIRFLDLRHYRNIVISSVNKMISIVISPAPMILIETERRYGEPRHDKTNKMTVRPAKTQISLGIRPI